MSTVTLLVYVNGSGVQIDVHPDIFKRFKNLHHEQVHHDTPDKISKINSDHMLGITIEDRLDSAKKLAQRIF